jgi:adenosylhomocysteine nucleosidase
VIGVVSAIGREVSDFLDQGGFVVSDEQEGVRFFESATMPNVVLVEGGMGREKAERATRLLVEQREPDLIVSAGFAGGVKPGAQAGDLFICNQLWALPGPATFWTEDGAQSRTLIDGKLMSRLSDSIEAVAGGCTWGTCLTVDQFVYNHDLKGWIGETFSVDVIDMESYWVSEVAAEHKLPHLVVRTVLDPMEQRLPPFVSEAAEDEKARTLLKGAAHIARHPGDLRKLVALSRQVRRASAQLANALNAVVTAEAWTPAYQLGTA